MRRFVSVLLVLVAVPCLLVGVGTVLAFGTDDRVSSGLQPVSSGATVAASAPDLLRVAGPEVRVTARLPDSRPVFIGLGNAVDVASYTDAVALTSVDTVSARVSRTRPITLGVSQVAGGAALPAAPTEVDWWLASGAGRGEATVLVELPPDQASVVVFALDDQPLGDLQVRASYVLPGAFGVGLGLIGLAVGLTMFWWLVRKPVRAASPRGPGAQPARDTGPRPGSGTGAERPGRSQRRALSVAVVLACALTLSGCELPRPVAGEPSKQAATDEEAAQVVARWAEQRAEALRLLDADPLDQVEAGPTLAIDEGAFEVARLLFEGDANEVRQDLRLVSAQSPRLARYPLWFVAVVDDRERDVSKLQIHSRETAAGPWRLVDQVEVLAGTNLPDLDVDGSGAIVPVGPDQGEGLTAAPQEIADAYAALLDDDSADGNDLVAVDSFVQQMRAVAPAQSAVKGVRLQQSWSAGDVQWALRTEDGGVLVFVTLARTDDYRLDDPRAIRWAEGSEQQAFLKGTKDTAPTLEYVHEVLVYVPPQGAGQASAVGQYGGVVSGPGAGADG